MQSFQRVSILVALALVMTSLGVGLAAAQSAGANPTGGTCCRPFDGSLEAAGTAPTPVATATFSLASGVRFWTGLTIYRLFAPSFIAPSRAAFAPSRLARRRTWR
jgi:hypothetical protein